MADEKAVQHTVDAVLARIDRRPRFSVIWGGVALAAVAVGAISSNLLGDRSPLFQMAQSSRDAAQTQTASKPEPLLIALDQPLIAISKTPVAEQADRESPSHCCRKTQIPTSVNCKAFWTTRTPKPCAYPH